MAQLVDVRGVRKIHGDGSGQPALDDVDLTIGKGEFVAVMGPSGSGKSTLLNLVAGLDRPTSGGVVVDGQELNALGEAELARFRRRRIGFMFQFFHLLNNMTVLENVMVPAELSGMRPSLAQRRAEEVLSLLGIASLAGQFPVRISGGQQQRVAAARALVNRPVLLLADEPTGALDTRTGELLMELLVSLNRGGQTILMVTHDAGLAARYPGRVVSLLDGRVVDDVALDPARPGAVGGVPREVEAIPR